jgi:predicted unusual protein kinase regulating ubiquinone biosynthesis (AarF/ABC1/UbiB family)
MGEQLPGFERASYISAVAGLMAKHYDLAVGEAQAGKVLYELINISYQKSLRLPAELTLLAKAMFNLDGVTRAIDPSFSPIPTIRKYGNEMAQERAKRDLNPRRLFQLATQGSDLLMALPHRLDLITERMAANELEFRMQVPQLTQVMTGMQKVANRVFSGLVLAGLLVASAMLMPHRRALATTGFVLAGAIGLWMVLTILWTDRRSKDP